MRRIVLDSGPDGDIEGAKGENGQFLTRDDKQLNIMYLKLIKSDIYRIGGATYHNDDGNCVFVFYGDDVAYGIERIFLRNLLKLFGEQYKVVSVDEYIDEKDEISTYVTTNLPWEMYMSEETKLQDEDWRWFP